MRSALHFMVGTHTARHLPATLCSLPCWIMQERVCGRGRGCTGGEFLSGSVHNFAFRPSTSLLNQSVCAGARCAGSVNPQ